MSDDRQMHHCIQCHKLLPVQCGCVVCTCGTTEVDFCVPMTEEQTSILSMDDVESRLKKHAESAPYWLLHECENEWAASSVALMDEAAQKISRLASLASALKVCERWLQKQVAERDAKIESLQKQLEEYQSFENALKSKAWEEECWNDE